MKEIDVLDLLVDDIDAGRLKPRTHTVARRLAKLQTRDDPIMAEIMSACGTGEATPDPSLLERLWRKIEASEPAQQGALRTLVALLQPDAPIDGHHAGYLILWAQNEGVDLDSIVSAFRGTAGDG